MLAEQLPREGGGGCAAAADQVESQPVEEHVQPGGLLLEVEAGAEQTALDGQREHRQAAAALAV
jgi:hypothetical protein